MLTVWKYQVQPIDYFDIEIPEHHKILTVQEQGNSVNIWALVNPDSRKRTVRFRLAGTGHPINEPEGRLNYIGTVQWLYGGLVSHLFEITGE